MSPLRLAVAALWVTSAVAAGTLSRSLLAQDGIYTAEQADRGAVLYEEQCVECHGALDQMMPEMAALLADHTFRARWEEKSLGELFELIQVEMPQDAPGSLSNADTADLLAFILRGNRRPPGNTALSADVETLRQIAFDPGS